MRKRIVTLITFILIITSIIVITLKYLDIDKDKKSDYQLVKDFEKIVEENKYDSAVEFLKNNKSFDINKTNSINIACRNNNYDMVKLLIDYHADLNVLEEQSNSEFISGFSPLYHAINNENIQLIKLLIENNADVDFKVYGPYSTGIPPLYYAIRKHNLDIVKLLVDNGANVDFIDKNMETYLHYAARQKNTDIIDYLVEKGLDINKRDKYGRTPLNDSLYANNINMANYLIDEYQLDINEISFSGRNLFHYAAVYNETNEVLPFLLSKGVDINAKDDKGFTPIMYAVENKRIFDFFINNGAKVTDKNNNNDTLLHLAVSSSSINYDIVEYLLSQKLNPLDKNNQGKSSIDIAYEKQDQYLIDMLS